MRITTRKVTSTPISILYSLIHAESESNVCQRATGRLVPFEEQQGDQDVPGPRAAATTRAGHEEGLGARVRSRKMVRAQRADAETAPSETLAAQSRRLSGQVSEFPGKIRAA